MSEQANLTWWLEQAHADHEQQRERERTNPRALAREHLSARIQGERELALERERGAFLDETEEDHWKVPPGAYGTFVDSIPDAIAYFIVTVNEGRWSFDPPLKVWRVRPNRTRKATDEEVVEALKAIITYGIETCRLLWEAAEFEHCGWCGRLLTRPESIERKFGPDCWANLLALEMMTQGGDAS